MRRLFLASSLGALLTTLVVLGCSAILGLEDRPVADADVDADFGNESSVTDGGRHDAQIPLIQCIGGKEAPAFFCDDFESPEMKPAWSRQTTGVGAQVNLFSYRDPSATDRTEAKALSGFHILETGFAPTPDAGNAYLRYTHGGVQGPFTVRFQFNLRNEYWSSGKRFHVASVTSTTGQQVKVLFEATKNGPRGNLLLEASGTDASFVITPIVDFTWVCVEIESNGSTVTARIASQPRGSATLAIKALQYLDLGYKDWDDPGNQNSRFFDWEDVIVSATPLGCN